MTQAHVTGLGWPPAPPADREPIDATAGTRVTSLGWPARMLVAPASAASPSTVVPTADVSPLAVATAPDVTPAAADPAPDASPSGIASATDASPSTVAPATDATLSAVAPATNPSEVVTATDAAPSEVAQEADTSPAAVSATPGATLAAVDLASVPPTADDSALHSPENAAHGVSNVASPDPIRTDQASGPSHLTGDGARGSAEASADGSADFAPTPGSPSQAAEPAAPATPAAPPGRPLHARESLVRDALAQLADDVSRETSIAARSAEVSRETPAAEVSRETVPPPEELADTPIAAAAATAMRVRDASDVFPRPPQTRIVTIANQKGGVGKTTTTVNLATALALHGSRVLCIDLDPQGNASTGLGIEHQSGTPSIYEVLINDRPMQEVVQQAAVPGLFCAPATIDLAGAEIELVSVVARETRLRRAIAAYQEPLDYVLIDCPPSLGLLTVNALVAAQEMLIPIQCEYYALEGLGQLLRNVDLVRSHLNQDLAVSTILLTMYDGRTRLAEQVAEEVRSHFGELVLGTAIPRSVRISEAPGYGQSVLTYDPASRGAVAYLAAAREFAERGARPATEESR